MKTVVKVVKWVVDASLCALFFVLCCLFIGGTIEFGKPVRYNEPTTYLHALASLASLVLFLGCSLLSIHFGKKSGLIK